MLKACLNKERGNDIQSSALKLPRTKQQSYRYHENTEIEQPKRREYLTLLKNLKYCSILVLFVNVLSTDNSWSLFLNGRLFPKFGRMSVTYRDDTGHIMRTWAYDLENLEKKSLVTVNRTLVRNMSNWHGLYKSANKFSKKQTL